MAPRNWLRRHRGQVALGALVVVGAATYLALRGGGTTAPAISYETEAVTLGTISVTVAGTGNVQVDGTTEVWPDAAGTIASIAVAEGSTVATGDVLFTLDAASAEAGTAKALASLRQAQQGVAQAKLQVTKAESALSTLEQRSADPSRTVSAAEVDVAEADVTVAKAQLASAQAQLVNASAEYAVAQSAEEDLSVTAPCSGIVHALGIEEGDSVTISGGSGGDDSSSNTPANDSSSGTSSAPVTIAPEQPLAVRLTVNEVDLPSLLPGQRADIEFDALPDLAATGKVYDIASEGANSSGVVTFDVWLSIDVADSALRSGMSAAATIVTEVARDTLIVSNSALHSDGDGDYYVLVMDSGAIEPRQVPVETGLASATQTEILSGLAEGDVVVTQTIDATDSDTGTPGGGGMMVPGMGGGFRG
ncbi:MAG: HlyD family efflux transporter periplasmic adaptor subunit [Coriobacteriia bacterium]|nr:HlyD family efflux transporter periplasmic adaptor subunit [Coriobacteriia bacterium]